jgi:hypothetical protein
LDWKYEELSEVEALLELVVVISKFSFMPWGAAIEFLALFPKMPITNAPLSPTVSEGAAIKRVLAL